MTEINGSFEIDYLRFAKFIRGLKAILPECRLHVEKDRIWVRGVDIADVAMVISSLPIEKQGEEETMLGIDLYKIGSLLDVIEKRYSPEDTKIRVSWRPGKETPLFDIECSPMFRFRFGTINPDEIRRDPNEPVLPLSSKFVCDGDQLSWAIYAGSICSDKCRFDASGKDGICYLAAKSDLPDQCRIPIGENVTEPGCTMFSLDYLRDIGKYWKGCREVSVAFRTDCPIEFSGEPLPGLHTKFLLAPRIETEEPTTGWME